MNKSKSGFSLIELLVAMAIMAVLLGLVGFGISTAQRNSRDSQRRQKVADIKLILEDYNSRFNQYPATLAYDAGSSNKSITVESGNTATTVKLDGPTVGIPSGTASTASGTVFCYAANTTSGGYKIGAMLESGSWYTASTDNTTGNTNCTKL